jgi:hypothetical protein
VDGYSPKSVKGSRLLHEDNVLSSQTLMNAPNLQSSWVSFSVEFTTNIRLLILINNIFVFPIYLGLFFLSFFLLSLRIFGEKTFFVNSPLCLCFYAQTPHGALILTAIMESWLSVQSALTATGATVATPVIASAMTILTKAKMAKMKTMMRKFITKKIN